MNYPYQITIVDYQRLKDSNEDIKFGHYFVFRQVQKKPQGRLARLCSGKRHQEVLPLVNESVLAVGDDVRVILQPRPLELVTCLVSNRDLYRAERDPVHLFIAVPKPPADLRLQVTWNGTSFCHRVVTLQESMAIETFALLLPGHYTAQLTSGTQRLGLPVNFTVAEYQLAPLTGRLVSHQLDRDSQYLWFELAVDSYQQPFTEPLIVELIEEGKAIARVGLLPITPGQYTGGLPLSGEKALRLRLMAAADPDKIAEVVIPGSRKQERQVSVISELGQEFRFAMMPEAQAIPLRGGYLSKGEEILASPLLVEEIVTNQRQLQVRDNIEALVLVNLDLITGVYSTQLIGNVSAGSTINVASTGTMSMTFAGGFVDEASFEAYTTFIQPTHFNLSLDTPRTLKPRDNLVIRLGCEGVSGTVPVLVCVRDARLTATEMPAVSLGASAKRNIDAALVDMNEWSFVGWQELAPPPPSPPRNLSPKTTPQPAEQVVPDATDEFMAIFLDEEAEEILENIQSLLERWQATPHNLALVQELQNELNTLKGGSRMVGINAMADLSHSLEFILTKIVEEGAQSNSKLQEIVQNGVNELVAMLEAVRSGAPLASLAMPTDLMPLLERSARPLLGSAAVDYDEIRVGTAAPEEELSMAADLSLDADLSMDTVETTAESADDDLIWDLGEESAPLTATASPTAVTSAPPATVTSKPAPPQTRTEFPEMLFYGLVPVTETARDLVLPVGEALTTWVVETFALRHGDWAQARTTVVVDQPVRLDLEVPPAVYPQDNVVGRIHVVTSSGTARLSLHCDGKPVELRSGKLTLCNPDLIMTPAELEFSVIPGHYQATVEDLHTHDTDSIETAVQEPTKVKSYRKALHLLQSGESLQTTPGPSLLRRGETTQRVPLLDKEGLGVVSLRLLPTLDTPFNALITATADYGHLCCEQTAAKIMAATLMYLTASDDPTRHRAEQIIITGIAREQKMFRPGRGFAMYPEWNDINEHYSKCAVFYLWRLQPLEALSDLSSSLRLAVQEGLDMANQAAVVHRLQRIPDRINQIEDAYTLATLQKMPEAIHQFNDTLIEFTGTEARLRKSSHNVADRTIMAYAAASLIALKDWQRGLRLANQVTRQFNAQGRLYSTVDSAAALALLQQLKLANVAMGTGQVRVNAKTMTLEEALTLAEPVTSVEVIEGVAAVEVTYLHTEDWESFGQPFPITVDFREPNILIVDDSLSARRSLSLLIEDAGFKTMCAKDGLEAIEVMNQKRPDVMLVDLEMPRMNGLELIAHVRANQATQNLPILVITSHTTEKYRLQAKAVGADAYLTKPFQDTEVLGWIEKALAGKMKATPTDSASHQKKRFALGNRLTLHIALPQGYRLGDIAHVVLPPCLSAIEGGAKVKRFTLDFAGQNQLRIPLLVTSKLQGTQHFAVCVRNMFEEERASSSGLLMVSSDTV